MEKTSVNGNDLPIAVGPYSHAIKAGEFLFVSGQIPVDPISGSIVGNDIKGQTKQVLVNLNNVLKTAGANPNDIVKTTVFLKDMNDFAVFNEIYAENFNPPYPARSCIEISRLPKDVLVEIEAIAIIK